MSDGGERPNVGTSGHIDNMCLGGVPKGRMVLVTGLSGLPLSKSMMHTLEKEGFYVLQMDYEELELRVKEELELVKELQALEVCDTLVVDPLLEVEEEPKPDPPYYERFRNNGRNKRRRY